MASNLGEGPHTISSVSKESERALLLYCPEQGGWHVGRWLVEKWAATVAPEHLLKPTHWMDVPASPSPQPWTRKEAVDLFKMYEDKGWAVKTQMISIVSWVTPIVFGLLAVAAKAQCSRSSPSDLLANVGPLASATASLIALFMVGLILGSLSHAEMDYRKADDIMEHAKKLHLFPGKVHTIIEKHIRNWLPPPLRLKLGQIGDVYVLVWWVYLALALIGAILFQQPEVLRCT